MIIVIQKINNLLNQLYTMKKNQLVCPQCNCKNINNDCDADCKHHTGNYQCEHIDDCIHFECNNCGCSFVITWWGKNGNNSD